MEREEGCCAFFFGSVFGTNTSGVWYKHTNPTTFFAVVVLQEREEEELPARHGQCHQCVWEGGGGAVFFPGSSLFFLRCFVGSGGGTLEGGSGQSVSVNPWTAGASTHLSVRVHERDRLGRPTQLVDVDVP